MQTSGGGAEVEDRANRSVSHYKVIRTHEYPSSGWSRTHIFYITFAERQHAHCNTVTLRFSRLTRVILGVIYFQSGNWLASF